MLKKGAQVALMAASLLAGSAFAAPYAPSKSAPRPRPMPETHKRTKSLAHMPVSVSVALTEEATGRDVVKIHRLSKRSYRWRIIDRKWNRDHDPRTGTGTATTYDAAEKAALTAWRR